MKKKHRKIKQEADEWRRLQRKGEVRGVVKPVSFSEQDPALYGEALKQAKVILSTLRDVEDVMGFGKWSHYKIRTVAEKDPSYILWAEEKGALNKFKK